jgi:hypothetical protein
VFAEKDTISGHNPSMDATYDVVEEFQRNALAWSMPRLIPELALYADLAEQLLAAAAAFPEDRIPDPPSKVSISLNWRCSPTGSSPSPRSP